MGKIFIYIKSSVEWLVMDNDRIVSSGCLNMAESSINKFQSQPLHALLPAEYSSLPCHVIIAGEHSISLNAELDCPKQHAYSAGEYALGEFSSQDISALHYNRYSADKLHTIEALDRNLLDNIYQSLEGLALVDMRFDYQLIPKPEDSTEALCLGQRLIIRTATSDLAEYQRASYVVHQSWAQIWWEKYRQTTDFEKTKIFGCLDDFCEGLEETLTRDLHKQRIDLDLCEPCAAADLEQLLCYQQHCQFSCNGNANLLSPSHPATANHYRLPSPKKPLLWLSYALSAAIAAYWGSHWLS